MTVDAAASTAEGMAAAGPIREAASGVLRADPAGLQLVATSPALRAALHLAPEDAIGRSACDALGLAAGLLGELTALALARGTPVEAEAELALKRGRIAARLIVSLLPTPAPAPHEWLLLLTAMHPASVQSNVLAAAPDAPISLGPDPQRDLLISFSPDLVVGRCSLSYAALYGRVPAEMIGRDLADWLPAEELARVRFAVAQNPVRDILNTSTAKKTLPDGSERWYRWIYVVTPAPAGDGTEILAIGIDITESELAQARLRDAIESINEGFVLFDRQGYLIMFNDHFRRMYPKSAPVIRPGVGMEEMLTFSAASGELGEIADPKAFAEETVRRARESPHLRYQRQLADGRWILVSQHRTSDGGYVGLRTDITAVKAHESAVEKAGEELAAKNRELELLADRLRDARVAADDSNRAKSRFLAHMSHELRTPLNGILGFAEVMSAGLFGPLEPPRYREYVQLIHNSGKLLLSLINDILDMSKIEAGRMELKIERVETSSLAESCRLMMAGMARDSAVVLKIQPAVECPELHVDERAAKQMIINLLSNAIKFTPPGGVVSLGFRELGVPGGSGTESRGFEISVTDNGIGMTPEELERALQPFGQIDSEMARQHKGSGIGLPLVQSLAELHGGHLLLSSEKNVGTTALIVLPRHDDMVNPGAAI